MTIGFLAFVGEKKQRDDNFFGIIRFGWPKTFISLEKRLFFAKKCVADLTGFI